MKKILLATGILLLIGAGCLNSATTPFNVSVKYRDSQVNIADNVFEYRDTSKSSWVDGAWYDSSEEYLVINLNNTYYHHCGITSTTWRSFKVASSYGTYYNSNIKGSYDCRTGYVPNY